MKETAVTVLEHRGADSLRTDALLEKVRMEFVGHVDRRHLAMDAELAEELDVRLGFMMEDEFAMLDRVTTRGNGTSPFTVRASRALLRLWDVGGKPFNNEQHIKQINIGTLKTASKNGSNSIHATWASAVFPKQMLDSRTLRQCFCINRQLPTSLFE